jgi:hypothetical protein
VRRDVKQNYGTKNIGRKRIGESLEKQSSFFVKQTNEVEISRGRMRRRKNSSELDHNAVK